MLQVKSECMQHKENENISINNTSPAYRSRHIVSVFHEATEEWSHAQQGRMKEQDKIV